MAGFLGRGRSRKLWVISSIAVAALLVGGAALYRAAGSASEGDTTPSEPRLASRAPQSSRGEVAPEQASALRGREATSPDLAEAAPELPSADSSNEDSALLSPEREPLRGSFDPGRTRGGWPPQVEDAKTPLLRAAVTGWQEPPFGPSVMRGPMDLQAQLDWERDYYIDHPAEYDRFVELFGDTHELR